MRQYIKPISMAIGGAWMTGLGARMLLEYFVNGNIHYVMNIFDIFFDWTTLSILGVVIVGYSMAEFYSLFKLK